MRTTPQEDIKTIWKDLKTDIPKFLYLFVVRFWWGLLTVILLLLALAIVAGWYFAPWFY